MTSPTLDSRLRERVFERLASSDKELVLWPGGRHELLNEVEREEVRQRLLGWLEPRVSA